MNPVLEEIKPETAERLLAQARAQGLSVDEYLRTLLPNGSKHPGQMSLQEIDQVLNELSEGTENLPPLPEDFSRKDIYSDHD